MAMRLLQRGQRNEQASRSQRDTIHFREIQKNRDNGYQTSSIPYGWQAYELFVLSHVLENLRQRGFGLTFQGTTLKFKASPGKIKLSDPHFLINSPQGPDWRLFVDIEFETFGSTQSQGGHDKSLRHEIDIVVVAATSGYPEGSLQPWS